MVEWKNVFLAGVGFAVIAFIIHTASSMLTMGYYTNPAYFPLWSKIMMPGEGPPGAEFFAYSLFFNFLVGAIFALAYGYVAPKLKQKTYWRTGFHYGLFLFAVSAVPGYLSMYLILAVPTTLVIAWAIDSLIVYLLGGALIAKILG